MYLAMVVFDVYVVLDDFLTLQVSICCGGH